MCVGLLHHVSIAGADVEPHELPSPEQLLQQIRGVSIPDPAKGTQQLVIRRLGADVPTLD